MIKTNLPIIALICLLATAVPGKQALAYHIGNLELKVGATGNAGYDTNITYVKDDPKRDYIMNATLALAAEYTGKTLTMSLSAYVNEQLFKRYHKYDNTSEGLNFNLKKEFSWWDRAGLTDSFIHATEPTSFDQAFGMVSGRYDYYKNRLNVTYDRELSRQFSLTANYGNSVDTFSRSDLSDSYLNNAGLGVNYNLTSMTIFSALYGFGARSFDPGKTAYTNSGTFAARQYLTNQLYLDGRVGVDHINSFDNKTYTKPSLYFAVTDELDKNMTSSLAFTKQFNANAYSQDVFDYWQVSGSFNRQLLRRFSLNLGGFIGKGTYVNQNIADDLYGGRVGLGYDLTDKLKATISYNYADTKSNVASREYKKNTVMAGVTGEF